MTYDITVVTPSYNQGAFIDASLRSVEAQQGVRVQHIIVDPGSTDESAAVIQAYAARAGDVSLVLGYDRSQTHAVNVGFGMAEAPVLTWLNSDDVYAHPEVLHRMVTAFDESGADIVYGRGRYVDQEGKTLKNAFVHADGEKIRQRMFSSLGILQPALALRRDAYARGGALDESMDFSFDYEYWARLAKSGLRFHFVDEIFAEATIHPDAKTMRSRRVSLEESLLAARRHYGAVAYEWCARMVDCETNDADGILTQTKKKDVAKIRQRFSDENSSKAALEGLCAFAHWPEAKASVEVFRQECSDTAYSRLVVTTFDDAYFSTGLTLIASLARSGFDGLVAVYDLGLKDEQKRLLRALKNVIVVPYPTGLGPSWPGYFHPKSYVYKCLAMYHVGLWAPQGAVILWMDAGVAVFDGIEDILEQIRVEGVFFVDHDDKKRWPFFNVSKTTAACLKAMNASVPEMLAPHLISCLMGYREGGPFAALFEEAFQMSLDEAVSVGEKHPRGRAFTVLPCDPQVLSDALSTAAVEPETLQEIFGFLGHRQDQSIFSILAARHGAPLQSATAFCVSSDTSSAVSVQNHLSGAMAEGVDSAAWRRFEFPPSATIHHRGLVNDYLGLRFEASESIGERAHILTGGLRPAGASQLVGAAIFAVDGAVRGFSATGWFAPYYLCVDAETADDLQSDIVALVQDHRAHGLRLAILPESFIAAAGLERFGDVVLSFERLRDGFGPWTVNGATSGTHAAAWARFLGYAEVIVHGPEAAPLAAALGGISTPGSGPWPALLAELRRLRTALVASPSSLTEGRPLDLQPGGMKAALELSHEAFSAWAAEERALIAFLRSGEGALNAEGALKHAEYFRIDATPGTVVGFGSDGLLVGTETDHDCGRLVFRLMDGGALDVAPLLAIKFEGLRSGRVELEGPSKRGSALASDSLAVPMKRRGGALEVALSLVDAQASQIRVTDISFQRRSEDARPLNRVGVGLDDLDLRTDLVEAIEGFRVARQARRPERLGAALAPRIFGTADAAVTFGEELRRFGSVEQLYFSAWMKFRNDYLEPPDYTKTTPQMPFVLGPLAMYWLEQEIKLQVGTGASYQSIYHPIEDGWHEVEVVYGHGIVALYVDRNAVGGIRIRTSYLNIGNAIFGGGFAQRLWSGQWLDPRLALIGEDGSDLDFPVQRAEAMSGIDSLTPPSTVSEGPSSERPPGAAAVSGADARPEPTTET